MDNFLKSFELQKRKQMEQNEKNVNLRQVKEKKHQKDMIRQFSRGMTPNKLP